MDQSSAADERCLRAPAEESRLTERASLMPMTAMMSGDRAYLGIPMR